MATPSFPTLNINLEDIIGKVEEVLKPVIDAFEEKFEAPVEPSFEGPGDFIYSDTFTDLVGSLKGQEKRIIESDLASDEKIYALNNLYGTWAGLVK